MAEHRPIHSPRQILERVSCGCAHELMDSHFIHANPEEDLEDVLHRQLEFYVEDMVVIDEQQHLLGTINLTTVLREFLENSDEINSTF